MTILCHTREISSKSHPIALSRNLKFWHAGLIHRNSNFQCKKKKKPNYCYKHRVHTTHLYKIQSKTNLYNEK